MDHLALTAVHLDLKHLRSQHKIEVWKDETNFHFNFQKTLFKLPHFQSERCHFADSRVRRCKAVTIDTYDKQSTPENSLYCSERREMRTTPQLLQGNTTYLDKLLDW